MAAPADSEAAAYGAFVDAAMNQVHAGLEVDRSAKKNKIADALNNHVRPNPSNTLSAGERVLLGRFALGADDAAYLQTGLATLWSTAPDAKNGNGDLALSPPGLYTPDAVDGIRAGLLRALKTKNRALERNAPSQIEALLPALKLVLSISTIRDAVAPKAGDPNAPPKGLDEVLSYPWSDRNQALDSLAP